ncbi:hypothetical protein TNCV_3108921 [Trichonephila clavipes]|nr:hypothetical protein TNCV_3108921 [Trichonephila clavipes]
MLQLSARTATRRIELIASNLEAKLANDVETSEFFSIQLDESTDAVDTAQLIVRVQYFVRGGTVGYRSLVSSKHRSSLIFRSTVFDSSGVKKGLRCSCKMHVWVSGPTKTPTAVDVRRSDVTLFKSG